VDCGDRCAYFGHGAGERVPDPGDPGAAGDADYRVRSGRVGDGAALRQARPEEVLRPIPGAAGGESGAAEEPEAGAVETCGDSQRARAGERGDDPADDGGARFESF